MATFVGGLDHWLLVGLCWLDARADAPGVEAGLPGASLMPVLLLLTVLATQEVLRLAAGGGHPPGGVADLCRQFAAGGCPMVAGS